MKRMIVLVVTVCLASNILAIGNSEKAGKPAIGFSISTLNNPFFVTLEEGARAKAEELGYYLSVLDAQDDPRKQLNDIEDLIRKNVAVILINPTASDALVSAIESANKANIPVITVDRSTSGGEVVAHIASDNVAGGELAGKYLLETLGNGAKVIELEGVPGASATRDRGRGFNESISGFLDVVARQTAHFNRAEGLSVMENLLQANKNIDGIFAHNDEMALGAISALKVAGITDVIVVGFDATDDAVAAIQAGSMAATVAQKPNFIGELSVEIADKVLKGERVDVNISVELSLVKN